MSLSLSLSSAAASAMALRPNGRIDFAEVDLSMDIDFEKSEMKNVQSNGAKVESNNAVTKSLKRPRLDAQDESRSLTKKALLDSNISADAVRFQLQKSPVALLNQLRRPLQYCIVSQVGPSHSTSFTISVMVDGQQYVGVGPSKRLARADAASKALAVILHPDVLPENNAHDFTSDEHIANKDTQSQTKSSTLESNSTESKEITVINKSPINLVYEKFPEVIFTCMPIDSDSCLKFKVICSIKDAKYEGFGSSKRSAKLGAAKVALAALGINLPIKTLRKEIDQLEPAPVLPSILPLPTPPGPGPDSSNLHQSLADRISKYSHALR